MADTRNLKALDLFCGSGGASMGMHRAGFDVTGVDINPQPRYPFRFVQADALTYPLEGFDFIWASPPCQRYSVVTPKKHRVLHPDLIYLVRNRVWGPCVIENVMGARKHFFPDAFMLCGSMFGLRTRRHRLFECIGFECSPPCKCDHSKKPLLVTTAGANSRAIGNFKSVNNAPLAYGINWMDGKGLKEAIPPAYSEYIARQFLAGVTDAK